MAISNERKLRVLSIAHPAVSLDIGRRRYHSFGNRPDIELHLLVPKRWSEYGRTIEADPSDGSGIHLHILPIWLPRVPIAKWYCHIYPGLGRLIKEIDPHVIHLWEEPWGFVALQACLLKRKAAFLLEVDQNILRRLGFPFDTIRKFVLRRTDHVLPRSKDAEDVVSECGYQGPVTSIKYGVDRETFSPDSQSKRRPEVPGLRLGYVGRLVVEKGLDDAIEALASTPSNVTLEIMGEGPYRISLETRISSLGLQDRVKFRGWDSQLEVAAFMRTLDALVLLPRTSRTWREQFGRVIIECQSCGVPVIGSACGAIPDVVADGGWIVPESNPEALAECIRSIIADRTELHRRAARGLINVETHYTYGAVAQALESSWVSAARALEGN
ncbi:glycosyltransferase [Rhizobium tumorigenes]|uniref:Glycosyltransferase n=1 Tax=Rhizobium tumorigenes TaxID=2041385 RepID=A0AAF1KS78_9HYPH|nr:glycosyltransferase [Rhizobium tumorigenes]WFR97602.1 glycosyltransferase [Rhizobium tumorigenes]WFS03205.1 glycosyltransferase [Rhizobium tumorigenes]